MRKLVFLLVILFAAFSANAQTGDLTLDKGVSAHKGIDAIYQTFSESYRTFDVEKVSSLYTETAAYLVPNDEISQGRERIRSSFKFYFDYLKKEGRTVTISFQIVQRKVDKNLAYDVGIFTIRESKDGRQINVGQGKFVVVAVKEKGGVWRFQVDGYSDLKPPEKKS